MFSSTAASYGIPKVVPITEDQPSLPINPYGESKVIVETILKTLDQYRGFRSIRLRYFNACGSEPDAGLGECHEPETHLIPLLLRAVQTGRPVTLFGDDYPTPDGTCVRDYIHVSDLAEAHVGAVEHLLSGGASNVFNVGTGHGHSVKEVVAAVERVTGKPVPHVVGPRREGDPPSLVADSTRLQQPWAGNRCGQTSNGLSAMRGSLRRPGSVGKERFPDFRSLDCLAVFDGDGSVQWSGGILGAMSAYMASGAKSISPGQARRRDQ